MDRHPVGDSGAGLPVLAMDGVSAGPPDPLAPAIVNDVTLALGPGQSGVLLGPNGSGKTTLIRVAAGLWLPRAGKVTGPARDGFSPAAVGLVLEEPEAQFVAGTVGGELAFVLENLGWAPGPLGDRVRHVLEAFQLTALADRDPRRLAAGEQGRVLVAAALAPAPPLLLLDDPFLHLGPGAGAEAWRLVRRLVSRAQAPATLLLTTHDSELALEVDRVGVLSEGRLLAWGEPDAVLRDLPDTIAPPLALGLEGALRSAGWPLPPGPLRAAKLAERIAEVAGR